MFEEEQKVYHVMPAGKYRLPVNIQLRFYGVNLFFFNILMVALMFKEYFTYSC